MLNSYINNIPINQHDFGLGVQLPVIELKFKNNRKQFLIGLQYTHNQSFNRNLYDLQTNKIMGVIEYKTIKFDIREINNSQKYKIFILDD